MPIYQSPADMAAFRCRIRFGPSDLRRIPLPAGSQNLIQGIDRTEIFGSDGTLF